MHACMRASKQADKRERARDPGMAAEGSVGESIKVTAGRGV